MKAASIVIDSSLLAISKAMVSVVTVAVGLGIVPPTAVVATVQVQGDIIRAWATGDDPTATEGEYLAPYDNVRLSGRSSIVNFRAIRDTAATGDATLAVQYWG